MNIGIRHARRYIERRVNERRSTEEKEEMDERPKRKASQPKSVTSENHHPPSLRLAINVAQREVFLASNLTIHERLTPA